MFNEDSIRNEQLNVHLKSLEDPDEARCDKCGCWVRYNPDNQIDYEYVCDECLEKGI